MEKEKFRQIGIDLINEYRQQRGIRLLDWLVIDTPETSAFIRSIQLHEKTKQELADCKQELSDFRQKVSGMGEAYIKHAFTVQEKHLTGYKVTVGFENHDDAIAWFDQLLFFPEFIIPKPKPDPLVEVLLDMELSSDLEEGQHDAKWIRNKLDALGFEIREKNDD